jgi:hypothetical protein
MTTGEQRQNDIEHQFFWKEDTGGKIPARVSFPNTGGAGVSTGTIGKRTSLARSATEFSKAKRVGN